MAESTQVIQIARSKPTLALLALATHHVLHTGEWDNSCHVLMSTWTIAFGCLAAAEYVYNPQMHSVMSAVTTAATAAIVYFALLTASVTIHRGFLHRLRRVSGLLILTRAN
jgi:ribose/xylose/arabinose/galactoside ABC-type transport system permease subunit